jgi:hypothetical protein
VRLLGGIDAALDQRSGQPDLAHVLSRGVFETRGTKVLGSWPLERSFVEGILGFSR